MPDNLWELIAVYLESTPPMLYREIAAIVGCSITKVWSVANDLGIRRRTGNPGLREEIAAYLESTPAVIYADIAATLGCSRTTVKTVAKDLGLNRPQSTTTPELREQIAAYLKRTPVLGQRDIAAALGCSVDRVRRVAKELGLQRRGGSRPNLERHARLRELRAEGLTMAEIALILSEPGRRPISKQAVYSLLRTSRTIEAASGAP